MMPILAAIAAWVRPSDCRACFIWIGVISEQFVGELSIRRVIDSVRHIHSLRLWQHRASALHHLIKLLLVQLNTHLARNNPFKIHLFDNYCVAAVVHNHHLYCFWLGGFASPLEITIPSPCRYRKLVCDYFSVLFDPVFALVQLVILAILPS